MRQELLDWALRIPGLQCYLFRRTYPELEKNHILPSLTEFPKGIGVYKKQDKRWELYNGSIIHFSHSQHESDIYQYQGAEIHILSIDELTTFTELMYDYLRARVRCALPVPEEFRAKIPFIVCASNPGGVGHEFCKRRWVDSAEEFEVKRAPDNQGGMLRTYIPSKLSDNKILAKMDPNYIHRLDALPEPLRTAYKDGSWNLHLGQAFHFNSQHHVCEPHPVPEFAPLFMSFDWGFSAPSSICWFYLDPDNRLFLFDEWYTYNGTPNQGIRMTDSELAQGIKDREMKMNIWGRDIVRLCDPTCLNKKPDYKGGGQGESTYETFLKYDIRMMPGDANRKLKIRQFHERLRVPDDGTKPMLQVYSSCTQFIRTIPLIQNDPTFVEDVDTKGEDHIYDSACHIFMSRPVGPYNEEAMKVAEERKREEVLSKLDSTSRFAAEHIKKVKEEAQRQYEYGDLFV